MNRATFILYVIFILCFIICAILLLIFFYNTFSTLIRKEDGKIQKEKKELLIKYIRIFGYIMFIIFILLLASIAL